MSSTSLAEKLNPQKRGFSPKLAAIVGAILGHDYGVRDRKGGQLTSLSITSDSHVVARSTASDGGGAFIGGADEVDLNLTQLLHDEGVTEEDRTEFDRLYKQNVNDWRLN